MSYPMVHLEIAYELLARYDGENIGQPGDFLLGSVAPDAVHFHEKYDISLKEQSHLWKFGPRWGLTLDSEGWRDAICKFWRENRNAENRDFMAGYCTHLLTDWENDKCIWTPFREKMLQGTEIDEVHAQYGAEAYGIDQWLYQTSKDSEEIWRLLEQGHIYGVEGCILKEDLARQKQSLLNDQFSGKPLPDISGNQFCTREMMEEFVEKCVERILQKITNRENC
ncbi:MAG: hypothetical protein K2N43_01645 [Lachnospiraceae bacterium]|nr:hypothetical protein [Lachnospiraceae bacterium]